MERGIGEQSKSKSKQQKKLITKGQIEELA